MYYNKLLNKFVFDLIDYFLLSAIISFYTTQYLKSYFSEKQKMERLRQDLISQSKLLESSKQPNSLRLLSSSRSIPIISSIRGGDKLFEISENLNVFITCVLTALKNKMGNNLLFNFCLASAIGYVRLILSFWKIIVTFYCADPTTGEMKAQVLAIGLGTGGTVGVFASWLGASATVFSHLLVLGFLGRSAAQQMIFFKDYIQIRNEISRLLDHKKIHKAILKIAQRIKNPNLKLKLKPLHWEQNRALKKLLNV